MTRQEFIDSISYVIDDWKNTSFTFTPKDYVPGIDDSNLTYGNGEEKKGIEIKTCVLYVDIRNSVQLTQDRQVRTMGKLYSVFTQCVLMAAQYEGGYVRNIIGDRVMVVFPPDGCFRKAVYCAITINHIASMINKVFDNFEFKCGIGVDYGRLSVMKVGIQKKGAENDDNKGLVWVGYPANYASRLTDYANKEVSDVFYMVDGSFYEYHYFESPLLGFRKTGYYRKTQKYTAEELASDLKISQYGQIIELSSCNKVYSILKKEERYTYKPILLSNKVYEEYAKANPKANDIQNKLWHKESRKIRDIDFDVWGSGLIW